jgi:hypothetical protein
MSSATPAAASAISSSSSSTESSVVAADYGPITPADAHSQSPLTPTSASKRFNYFAYGSNLLPAMLLLKEVKVHSVRPGFLQDVQLLFDLKYDSLVEPCYANLQRKVGARTHGVVYSLDARDMKTMDMAEG